MGMKLKASGFGFLWADGNVQVDCGDGTTPNGLKTTDVYILHGDYTVDM